MEELKASRRQQHLADAIVSSILDGAIAKLRSVGTPEGQKEGE